MIRVTAETLIVPGGVLRIRSRLAAATQLGLMHILNVNCLKRVCEFRLVELWVAARSGKGPDVDKSLDLMGGEDLDELFDRPCGMPDGPDC